MFEYIALLYNLKRNWTDSGILSPLDFESSLHSLTEAGVWETRGTSRRTLNVSNVPVGRELFVYHFEKHLDKVLCAGRLSRLLQPIQTDGIPNIRIDYIKWYDVAVSKVPFQSPRISQDCIAIG